MHNVILCILKLFLALNLVNLRDYFEQFFLKSLKFVFIGCNFEVKYRMNRFSATIHYYCADHLQYIV